MEFKEDPQFFRATRARVDLKAIEKNFLLARSLIKGSGDLFPIVKANAYGHGAKEVSQVLEQKGAKALGVATPKEAWELRQEGVKGSLLVLGGPMEAPAEFLREFKITPCLFEIEHLNKLEAELKAPFKVQLKVDTGMGRLGFWYRNLSIILKRLHNSSKLILEGVFSHLASAEEPQSQAVKKQRELFEQVKSLVTQFFPQTPCFHLANSAALLAGTLQAGDWARPGLMLYGVSPEASLPSSLQLKPAMHFLTKIFSLKKVPKGQAVSYGGTWVAPRESLVALLPVGYADGYPRSLSNKGEVVIASRRFPVVGRVCMDLTLVDVTDLKEAHLGQEVELWGEQMPVSEVAEKAGTISYELLCGVSGRVPRVYAKSS